jgi:type IV secretory pathway TrbL component
MDISLGYVLLMLGAVVVACLLVRYMKLIIHLAVLFGKLALIALAAFVVVYATGIWRPDLAPLLWLLGKLWSIVG